MCIDRGTQFSSRSDSTRLGFTPFPLLFLVSAPALKGQYNSNWAERDATPSLDASSNSDHKINSPGCFQPVAL